MSFFDSLTSLQKGILGLALVALLIALCVFLFNRKQEPAAPPPRKVPQGPPPMPLAPPQQDQGEPPQQGPPQQQDAGALVLFFAPWCGHCQTLEPVWDEFVRNFDGYHGVKLLKINGNDNPGLMGVHGLKGFPSIKYCPMGPENPAGVMFEGERSPQGLAGFLQQVVG